MVGQVPCERRASDPSGRSDLETLITSTEYVRYKPGRGSSITQGVANKLITLLLPATKKAITMSLGMNTTSIHILSYLVYCEM
ncbi:hypothetical protein E2C01_026940 [Portunus trituberculatus]|uniref:Uncharacterized protein n=1 Tax=Portunus trituberculatus TaxID=210409 RepID=A0A5B7EMF1_PORTR|nr:hypothetical protein [Portunus trituberculatus]